MPTKRFQVVALTKVVLIAGCFSISSLLNTSRSPPNEAVEVGHRPMRSLLSLVDTDTTGTRQTLLSRLIALMSATTSVPNDYEYTASSFTSISTYCTTLDYYNMTKIINNTIDDPSAQKISKCDITCAGADDNCWKVELGFTNADLLSNATYQIGMKGLVKLNGPIMLMSLTNITECPATNALPKQEIVLKADNRGHIDPSAQTCELADIERNTQVEGGECAYVQCAESCQPESGFINYFTLNYCGTHSTALSILIFVIWIIFLFLALGATAEDFFCPALGVISDNLGLSHNVAGVTFLAFGNGAPDIFSVLSSIQSDPIKCLKKGVGPVDSWIAVSGCDELSVDVADDYLCQSGGAGAVAVGELFGSGAFVTAVVVGAVAYYVPFTVTRRPFVRDVGCYTIATCWLYFCLNDGKITLTEAVGFLVIYIVYVLVVIFGRKLYQEWKKNPEKAWFDWCRPPPQPLSVSSDDTVGVELHLGEITVTATEEEDDGEDEGAVPARVHEAFRSSPKLARRAFPGYLGELPNTHEDHRNHETLETPKVIEMGTAVAIGDGVHGEGEDDKLLGDEGVEEDAEDNKRDPYAPPWDQVIIVYFIYGIIYAIWY